MYGSQAHGSHEESGRPICEFSRAEEAHNLTSAANGNQLVVNTGSQSPYRNTVFCGLEVPPSM